MLYFLVSLIVCLLIGIVYLMIQNAQIKQVHYENMNKLQGVIALLHEKQILLNDKISIATAYSTTHKNDMKTLGETIVELQKVFVEIVSNKNNK